MKILLIGEYSRLHNSLKEGLVQLGHEVVIIGDGDGFKNYPVDIKIGSRIFNNSFWHPITKSLHRISSINLIALENAFSFYKKLDKFKNFDAVQIINEGVLKTYPKFEIYLLKRILKQNKSIFLLSCGIDYITVKYAFDKNYRYSILTPLEENKNHKSYYKNILNKLKPSHKKLHHFLYNNTNGIISTDIDYHLPHIGKKSYLGMIPNPINTDKIIFKKLNLDENIIIFHGVNTGGFIKKGNIFFDEALKVIEAKYTNKVKVIRTENIPYNEYLKLYNSCHIFLDQVYAYDQGYNALEAMAKGKVVFTGAEQEWLDYYNLKENSVAINAKPDVESIVENLEWLINNPEQIEIISQNARHFIEKEHNYINIAQKYLDTWSQNKS